MSSKEIVKRDDRGGKGKKAAGVDNTFRRTWDKEEYAEKAAAREEEEAAAEESALDLKKRKRVERDPLHQGLIVQRSHLQGRAYDLQLGAKLGKTQVVGQGTALSQQPGFYCSVCDCVLRDSTSYLDHINGKWHNRALGMSMRVERVGVDVVKQKFEALKKQKDAPGPADSYTPDGFERAVQRQQEEEERRKRERRESKRSKTRDDGKEGREEEEGDPDMMALMGFGGFK